jgi:hypothetical protein
MVIPAVRVVAMNSGWRSIFKNRYKVGNPRTPNLQVPGLTLSESHELLKDCVVR